MTKHTAILPIYQKLRLSPLPNKEVSFFCDPLFYAQVVLVQSHAVRNGLGFYSLHNVRWVRC